MNSQQIESLRQRLAAGEKLAALAKEAGVSWQKLHGMLIGSGNQQTPPRLQQEQESTGRNPVVRDADGIDRITFESVGEAVIDALADYAQNEGNRKLLAERSAYHLTGSDRWANYFTREKLLDVIKNPPAELTSAVEEMRQSLVDEISPPVCTRRRVRRNQESGDELDPEAVLTRSLTPWERMTRENQPRRSVTIGVNLTVHCGQRAEALLWRGAAAAALADILTQRGISVEILAFWSIGDMSSRSSRVVAKYVIKRADMPLDIGSVSVALAEIAFSRLVALYGLARHVPGKLSEGLGTCEKLTAQDRAGIDYLAESDITSRTAAEAWLRAAASRQESEVLHV